MPSSAQKPAPKGAIAAACALAIAALTANFEGLRTRPYHDPGDGRLTVCYGETEREMRNYTPEECAMLLQARQERDYAPKVLKCVPGLADRRNAFAASIDAAYNAGVAAFCRSRMARAFNQGKWVEGCNGFVGWYETAKGKKLRGLVRRRAAERALCLKNEASGNISPKII
jgi:lysozyme